MYFIPEKGRLYRWAVHTRPIYRYGITVAIISLLAGSWFFIARPWFVGLVQYEQAALMRTGQLQSEAMNADRIMKVRDMQLRRAEQAIQDITAQHNPRDQIAFLLHEAHKVGVQINSFAKNKSKKKEWRMKNYMSLSANGTLDNLFHLLSALRKSPHMIQCKQLALQRADSNLYSMQCQLECIILPT